MDKRWCDVTVEIPDGKRHTITVESASVYEAAIMEFFGRSGATFPADSLPPTNKEVFEVRPIYRVTQKQLMDWANKKAELYARSRKFRKFR